MITRTEYDALLETLDGGDARTNNPIVAQLVGGQNGFDDHFVEDTVALLAADRRPVHVSKQRPARVFNLWRYAVAATVVVAVAAVVAIFARTGPDFERQIGPRHITLADGSRVVLAPGSQLSTEQWSPSRRAVQLHGEGYFDVTHDDTPFIVSLTEGDVVVTGTRFNVRSWPGMLTFAELTLLDGSVRIERAGFEPDNVQPGQSVRFSTDRPTRTAIADSAQTLAWTAGAFAFHDESIAPAFQEVARRYGVRVSFDDNVDLSRSITFLSPKERPLADVLSDMCHALNLQYSQTRSGYEIRQSEQ